MNGSKRGIFIVHVSDLLYFWLDRKNAGQNLGVSGDIFEAKLSSPAIQRRKEVLYLTFFLIFPLNQNPRDEKAPKLGWD